MLKFVNIKESEKKRWNDDYDDDDDHHYQVQKMHIMAFVYNNILLCLHTCLIPLWPGLLKHTKKIPKNLMLS